MQLVSAELFSRAHGLVQSSGTNKEPQSLSGNPAASSPKSSSVNKGKAAPTSPKSVGIDKQSTGAASPRASGKSKQKSAVASPEPGSASKQKADKLNQRDEVQTLDTKTSPPEKRQSRLERKLSASKRKDRDEGNNFGISLSPAKRQRGDVPASDERGKASKASRKAQGSKAVDTRIGAIDKGKKKETSTVAARRSSRRGIDPGNKSNEKKKGVIGKRKRGPVKSEDEEDVETRSPQSLSQRPKQAQKPASSKKTKAAEQTPKKR